MTIDSFLKHINTLNIELDKLIAKYLSPYFPTTNLNELPFFSKNMPQFAKYLFLSAATLIILFIIKVIIPDKRWVNFFIFLVLFVAGGCLIGFYIGLLQLLYM
jgi:hypothetical protein